MGSSSAVGGALRILKGLMNTEDVNFKLSLTLLAQDTFGTCNDKMISNQSC